MQRLNLTPEEYAELEEANLAEIRKEVKENTHRAFTFWQEKVKPGSPSRTQRLISKPEADQSTVLSKPSTNEPQPLEKQAEQTIKRPENAIALLDAVLEADYDRAKEFARTTPSAMFQEVTITTPAGNELKTSPLKQAFYNLDFYMWKKFEEIAKENNMLPQFEKQLQEQDSHIDLNALVDKYNEYRFNKKMPSRELQAMQTRYLVNKFTGARHVLREFARKDLQITFNYYKHRYEPNKNTKVGNIRFWIGEEISFESLSGSSQASTYGIQIGTDGLVFVPNLIRGSLHYDEFTLKGIIELRMNQLQNRRKLLKPTPSDLGSEQNPRPKMA